MRINADFDERVVIRPADYRWVNSPTPGVERMMLDRIGGEVARATSLVRYAPNSRFPAHTHGGGEEIYVLAGEFADDRGRYPVGTYIRNPIGTSHAPQVGPQGATIFVKLHQFDAGDLAQKAIDTMHESWLPGLIEGLQVMPLHEHGGEHVALVRWAPSTTFQTHTHWGGEEILVIEGTFYDERGEYPAGSWIRNPHRRRHAPYTKGDGTLIYVKVGHLPENAETIERALGT